MFEIKMHVGLSRLVCCLLEQYVIEGNDLNFNLFCTRGGLQKRDIKFQINFAWLVQAQ